LAHAVITKIVVREREIPSLMFAGAR